MVDFSRARCRMETDEVLIATFPNRALAEISAGLLESAEIPFRIASDDAGGAYPMLDLTRGVRLWVASADADQARELLDLP
jgi:hypothetical protein